MDKNIKLVKIDRKSGVGYFEEYGPGNYVLRKIEIDLKNMNGSGYECSNFHARKDGTCKFNGKEYKSIKDLMTMKIEKQHNSKEISTPAEYSDVRTMVANMMHLGNMIGTNKNALNTNSVQKITIESEKDVYVHVDSEMNVIIAVPEDVKILSQVLPFTDWWKSDTKLNKITLIGGSPALVGLVALFNEVKCNSIDMSKLYISNVIRTEKMYNDACIEELDLTWTKRCKIADASSMFEGYHGKVIPLFQMNLEHVKSLDDCFSLSTAFIDFSGMNKRCTPNLITTTNMFYRYNNKKQRLWLNWLDMSKVWWTNSMFYQTTCNMVDISDWDLGTLTEAVGMFEHINTGVIGLNGTEHARGGIIFKKLYHADRMFSNVLWNQDVVLHIPNGTLEKSDRMFMGSSIKSVNITDVEITEYQLKLKEHMFSNMKGRIKMTKKQEKILHELLSKRKTKAEVEII